MFGTQGINDISFGKPQKIIDDDDDEMDTVTYQFSTATGLQRLDQPSVDSQDDLMKPVAVETIHEDPEEEVKTPGTEDTSDDADPNEANCKGQLTKFGITPGEDVGETPGMELDKQENTAAEAA